MERKQTKKKANFDEFRYFFFLSFVAKDSWTPADADDPSHPFSTKEGTRWCHPRNHVAVFLGVCCDAETSLGDETPLLRPVPFLRLKRRVPTDRVTNPNFFFRHSRNLCSSGKRHSSDTDFKALQCTEVLQPVAGCDSGEVPEGRFLL